MLLLRNREEAWELPKGGIEWDELPREAACRELCEEAGVAGRLAFTEELGTLEYAVAHRKPEPGHHRKRVTYYRADGDFEELALPPRTFERQWASAKAIAELPLVSEALRGIAMRALLAS